MFKKICTDCGKEFTGDTLKQATYRLSGHRTGAHNPERWKHRRANALQAVVNAAKAPKTPPARPKRVVAPPWPSAPISTPAAPVVTPPPAPRKPKIVWTDDELQTLFEATALALVADPTRDALDTLRAAQDGCILPERHRVIGTWNALPDDARARIQAACARAVARKEQTAAAAVMPTLLKIEVPVQPDPAQFLKSIETPALVAELFSRFAKNFGGVAQLGSLLAGQLNGNGHAPAPPKERPPLPPPPPPEAPRKPRIAVVGLLKYQFEEVATKCADRNAELIFIDKDQSRTDFPQSVQAVIVEKHVDHRWSEQARSVFGPDRVLFAPGGTSSVVQKVYDYTSRQPRAGA